MFADTELIKSSFQAFELDVTKPVNSTSVVGIVPCGFHLLSSGRDGRGQALAAFLGLTPPLLGALCCSDVSPPLTVPPGINEPSNNKTWILNRLCH